MQEMKVFGYNHGIKEHEKKEYLVYSFMFFSFHPSPQSQNTPKLNTEIELNSSYINKNNIDFFVSFRLIQKGSFARFTLKEGKLFDLKEGKEAKVADDNLNYGQQFT